MSPTKQPNSVRNAILNGTNGPVSTNSQIKPQFHSGFQSCVNPSERVPLLRPGGYTYLDLGNGRQYIPPLDPRDLHLKVPEDEIQGGSPMLSPCDPNNASYMDQPRSFDEENSQREPACSPDAPAGPSPSNSACSDDADLGEAEWQFEFRSTMCGNTPNWAYLFVEFLLVMKLAFFSFFFVFAALNSSSEVGVEVLRMVASRAWTVPIDLVVLVALRLSTMVGSRFVRVVEKIVALWAPVSIWILLFAFVKLLARIFSS